MNKSHLEELLKAYLNAVEERSFDDIVHCSNMFEKSLKRIEPVRGLLEEDMKVLVIELQNTHVRALDVVRELRDALQAEMQYSSQYRSREKAYVQTQIRGQKEI